MIGDYTGKINLFFPANRLKQLSLARKEERVKREPDEMLSGCILEVMGGLAPKLGPVKFRRERARQLNELQFNSTI